MRPLLTSLSLRIVTVCLVFILIPFVVYAVLQDEGSEIALKHLILFLIFVVVIGGITTFVLVRRMSKPLKQLDEVMGKVEKGDFSIRYIPDKMGYEINILGNHFNRMINALVQLKLGEQIQKSLFPKIVPHFPGLTIKAGIVFAKELGGDYYDLLEVNGKLFLAIADASGKGVDACLHSLGVRSLMRAAVSSQANLQDALFLTNKLFCEDAAEGSYFVTAWAGCYDPQTRKLEYSSCGHPHALLFREGKALGLKTPGIALGVELNPPTVSSLTLQKEDLLLLYTDGVIEAPSMAGRQRLIEEVLSHQNLSTEALLEHLLAIASPSGAPSTDDITLLLISVND